MAVAIDGRSRFYLTFYQWTRLCSHSGCQRLKPQHTQHALKLYQPRARQCHDRATRYSTAARQPQRSSFHHSCRSSQIVDQSGFAKELNTSIEAAAAVHKGTALGTVSYDQKEQGQGVRSQSAVLDEESRLYPKEIEQKPHHSAVEGQIIDGLAESLDLSLKSGHEASISKYRSILSDLVNSVVIVTTNEPSSEETPSPFKHWHGVTLSSFTSLCIHPEPHITFNIHVESRTLAALRRQRMPQICVHLLAPGLQAVELARLFSSKHEHPMTPFLVARERGFVMETSATSLPLINGHSSVRAQLLCSADEDCVVKTVGDHHICVFKVTSVLEQHVDTHQTLAYTGGSYVMTSTSKGQSQLDSHSPVASRVAHKTENQNLRSDHLTPVNRAQPRPPAGAESMASRFTVRSMSSLSTASSISALRTPIMKPVQRRKKSSGPRPNQADAATYYPADSPSDSTADTSSRYGLAPSMAKETIADFLCHTEGFYRKRFQRLINMKRETEHAAQELEEFRRHGQSSSPVAHELRELIDGNQRFITRQLGMHAAHELEFMLDRAHVPHLRIQFLESSVERGQVALVDEARELSDRIDRFGPDVETDFVNRTRLLQEEEKLRNIMHRLREYVDDEQSDF